MVYFSKSSISLDLPSSRCLRPAAAGSFVGFSFKASAQLLTKSKTETGPDDSSSSQNPVCSWLSPS